MIRSLVDSIRLVNSGSRYRCHAKIGKRILAKASAAALVGPLLALPVSSQTMTLPGEFGVSQSGAATYKIPIVVPPGTAGMVPQLTLGYNSQAGNGLVGLGWALDGLPVVTRCPKTEAQDGVRGSVNYDTNDRFCLEGEKLVAITGTYGADGTEYRTEIESYSRIISRGSAGGGPAWFEVRTKSGQIMEFGNTTDSRILAQGKTVARDWAVSKISDLKGNYQTITYVNNNANGEYYPSRIDYTGNSAAALSPYNSVRFVYATRSDPQSIYQAGSVQNSTVLLSNIQTYSGTTMVSDYRLAFQLLGNSGRRVLNSVQLCDGAGSCSIPATTFGWQGQTAFLEALISQGVSWSNYNFITGDWNGDGRTDLFLQSKVPGGTSFMYVSDSNGALNGTGFYPVGWSADAYDIYTGDWNGDGKTDIALISRISGGASFFYHSTGSAFAGNGFYPTNWGGWKLAIGDWNGDGKTDILLYYPSIYSTAVVYVSTGNGGFTGIASAVGWGAYDIYTGDWNGDGKTDVAIIGKNAGETSYFYLSTGSGFAHTGFTPTTWGGWRMAIGDWNGDGKSDLLVYDPATASSAFMYMSKGDGTFVGGNVYPSWGAYNIFTGDWNGDGKTDIALMGTYSGAASFFYNSTGSSFSFNGYSTTSWGGHILAVGDWNGDGAHDIWLTHPSLGYTAYQYRSNYTPELLTTISNGLGATTTLTYKPASNPTVYTKETGAVYPVLDWAGSTYLVSRVTAPNGVGGTIAVGYAYAGAKLELSGRGFLGFRQLIETDLQTNVSKTTTYNQTYPLTNLAASEIKKIGTQTLSQVTNTHAATSLGGTRYSVVLSQSQAAGADLDGSPLPSATSTFTYDAFGNATQVQVTASDGFSKTTTNTYSNDSVNWILGRLTTATVTSTAPQ